MAFSQYKKKNHIFQTSSFLLISSLTFGNHHEVIQSEYQKEFTLLTLIYALITLTGTIIKTKSESLHDQSKLCLFITNESIH